MENGLLIGLITAISTAVILIIERSFSMWNASKKERHEESLAANDQAMKVYGALVKSLQEQIKQVRVDADKLEAEYMTCRENNVELRSELKQKTAACKCGAFLDLPQPPPPPPPSPPS